MGACEARRGAADSRHHTADGLSHEYAFVVPEAYDSTRPIQVRVQLHGGIGRPRPPVVNRIRVDSLPGAIDEIAVFPAGWAQSMWWSATQTDNLQRILDRLKRTYNIDEPRVSTGASDGEQGVLHGVQRPTLGELSADRRHIAHAVGRRRRLLPAPYR
jgi:poly(3-hydroxybutyrate) depolymerase